MENDKKILKVRFLQNSQTLVNLFNVGSVKSFGSHLPVEVIDVEFDELIKIISDIEKEYNGLGKSIHKEAFDGVDYMGNSVKFKSYVVWTEDKVFQYNFDESYVPFNNILLSRNRDNKINYIIK